MKEHRNMMTKEDAFLEYESELARIDEESHRASEAARATLREKLKALQAEAHQELKAIRAIEQKTKRR